MVKSTIAQFYRSTEEDLRFRYTFENRSFTGRTLRINVREIATNSVKFVLNSPANLTIGSSGVLGFPDNDVAAQLPLASMAGWPVGEYEVDLLDITTGSATRIVAGRVKMDLPGELVYGVAGNQATVRMEANQAIITATGGVGLPGPANVITIGDVETLAPGQPATAELTGESPNQVLDLGIPSGPTGGQGEKGWGPIFAIASDGARRVFRLADWSGGVGTKPPTLSGGNPQYLGPAGLTVTIGDASDVRGAIGLSGADGADGNDGADGEDGWSPILAVVADSGRRVLRITDWTGGTGSKPASGGYIGPTGIVATAAEAADIRGDQGPAGSVADGDKGDIVVASGGTSWTIDLGAVGTTKLADDAVTFDKTQNIATSRLLGRLTASAGNIEELTAAQARALLNLASNGQCQLTKVSSNLVLNPRNGNKLLINGAPETVPNGGISLAPTGLSASTLYYVYAYMNSGTMTLEASTTAPTEDTTTGAQIKTGDATRSLVGMAYVITGPAFADTATQRLVRSWFNPGRAVLSRSYTAQRTRTNTGWGEVDPEIQCQFVIWSGEVAHASINGYSFNSGSSSTFASVAFDSTTANEGVSLTFSSAGGPIGYSRPKAGLSTGFHYATVLGRTSGGTGTYSAGSPEFTSLDIVVG